ncbi:PREDICTED: olfactory receptor 18-like [Chinchilla lanigera]|uniref:olfactory receptor 18-like n=1 Tax=Chinchilla lanigera TaxID=34839 RepID=UPI0006991D16|nr:PREDICTED: olfactory receptor 18-like [Chinchilla lanigera]
MYLVTVLGNLLIILAVSSDSHLHTPMYFFLSNLSLADISFTSTTVPKMIMDTLTHSRVISYVGCLTQMYVYILFGSMDDMLLLVMAYDLFVAICHPLQYQVIMSPRFCGFLVVLSLLFSLLDSQLHNLIVLQLTYFKEAVISNFFCNPAQLINLSCSDNFSSNILKYIAGVLFGFLPIAGIFLSYYKIIYSILRIPSAGGKFKAFSTCGSHLSVVCLFYGTSIGVYLGSTVSQSPRNSLVASVIYTLVTPMLNPLIYSLRNRDIKKGIKNKIFVKYYMVPSFIIKSWPSLYSDEIGLDLRKSYLNSLNYKGNTEAHPLQFLELHHQKLKHTNLLSILLSLFLSMSPVMALGNLLIILAISSDSHLHTPMYFFLSNLSLAGICLVSTVVP